MSQLVQTPLSITIDNTQNNHKNATLNAQCSYAEYQSCCVAIKPIILTECHGVLFVLIA